MRQCGPAQPWGQRQSPAPSAPSWGTHSWGTGQLPGPPDPQRAEPTEALKPQDEEPLASQCSTSSPVGREARGMEQGQGQGQALLHPQVLRKTHVVGQGGQPPDLTAHPVPHLDHRVPSVLQPEFHFTHCLPLPQSLAWTPAPSPTGHPGSPTFCPLQHPT